MFVSIAIMPRLLSGLVVFVFEEAGIGSFGQLRPSTLCFELRSETTAAVTAVLQLLRLTCVLAQQELAKTFFDERAQSRVFPCRDGLRLREQRVRNLDGRLHMAAHIKTAGNK